MGIHRSWNWNFSHVTIQIQRYMNFGNYNDISNTKWAVDTAFPTRLHVCLAKTQISMCTRIRAFAGHSFSSQRSKASSSEHRRLCSGCANSQADLGLLCARMQFCRKYCAQLKCNKEFSKQCNNWYQDSRSLNFILSNTITWTICTDKAISSRIEWKIRSISLTSPCNV